MTFARDLDLPMWRDKPAGEACRECPLRDRPCVETEDHDGARLAIVGEAPGKVELEQGAPFVGPSGKVLGKLLRKHGYDREDVVWTNAVPCEVRKESELRKAVKLCQYRLHDELEGIQHVVPVGGYALQSVLRQKKKPSIMKARGFVYHLGDRLVLPTVHPAFVLRSPLWESVIDLDFDRVQRIATHGWMPPEKLYGRKQLFVKTIEALRRECASLSKTVSLDVETTEDAATRNQLICFSITNIPKADKTIVVPWSVDMSGNGRYFGSRQHEVVDIINECLDRRVAVTHNGPSFDHIVLARYGMYVGDWDDTLIAHHAFASHMPQRLSHVVSIYLDAPPWKEQREDTIEDLYRYNSQDTIYTAIAWHEMKSDMESERAIYEMDCVSSDLCRDMQEVGFRFDVRRAKKLRRKLKRQLDDTCRKANDILGREVNLSSVVQLREAFFRDLDAPIFFKSVKTGQPALNVDALRAYASYSDERLREMSLAVLDYRKARKVKGTYIDPILLTLDAEQRVHPSWRSFGAVSGRYSCRTPNLMNLPRPENDPSWSKDDPKGTGVRSLYIASPGNVIVGYDFAQLEMRIAAYVSGDEVMISACEADDLHSANAASLFGEAFTKLDPDKDKAEWKMLRTIAKTSGFAIAYMASAPTVYARIVAQGLDMTLQQVEKLLKKMRQTFSAYYEWQEQQLYKTMRTGFVEIPLSKRKRWTGHNPKPTEVANCCDDRTEALTRRGWVNGMDLEPGDMLLTKSMDTGLMTWEPISKIKKFTEYEGPLIEFKSKSFNAVTTPDHRWLVSVKGVRDECRTSQELLDSGSGHYRIHRTGAYMGSTARTYTDDFVELVGWVITDGYMTRNYNRVGITQSIRANKRKVQMIDRLFERLGVVPRRVQKEGRVDWHLTGGTELVHVLRGLFPNKQLTAEFLLSLTRRQAELLLETMMLGDGNVDRLGKSTFCVAGETGRDMFQMLATMCGVASTSRWVDMSGHHPVSDKMKNVPESKGAWIVTLLHRDKAQVLVQSKTYGKNSKPIRQGRMFQAKRPVWCPVVRNTFFVARREGSVYVTGNTPIQGGAADVMNITLPRIVDAVPSEAKLVAQIHDAAMFDVPEHKADEVVSVIREIAESPFEIRGRQVSFPIDIAVGARWSEV